MEGFGFSDANNAVRKKRSTTSRRPRNDSPLPSDCLEISSLSSTPPSETVSKASSDENNDDSGSFSRKKKGSLILCSSRAPVTNFVDSGSAQNVIKQDDGGFGESDEASNNGSFRGSNEQRHSGVYCTRSCEGALAPANWKSTSSLAHFGVTSDGVASENNKVKKVKLKVGGVIRTINAKSASDGASAIGSSSTKPSRFPDTRQKAEDTLDDSRSTNPVKGSGLQGVPWKDFSRSSLGVGKTDVVRSTTLPEEDLSSKQADKYEAVRKSKRVPKKRLLDGVLDDEDEEDDEIRYLEKARTAKINAEYCAEYDDEEEAGTVKQQQISKVMKRNIDIGDRGSSRFSKEDKKSKSGRVFEDVDYFEEEEEIGSDGEPTTKRKKARKQLADLVGDSKKEMTVTVTTRQRALQTGKDISSNSGHSIIEFPNGLPPAPPKKQKENLSEVEQQLKRAEALQRRRLQVETVTTRQRALQTGKDISSNSGHSIIEFPNGLPPAPPKKQKENLSEVEQQLKRAEALQRRRLQVEKANRESEAEAIRKILGQDSTRKKREDKMKKRQEELAQERAASAMTLPPDIVRWAMGPSGTVVTFPSEMGLPTIFQLKTCSYPPPREKCAGPSCTNPYKYRDSKSNLPLCSLQCYKAIHEKAPALTAC